MPPVTSSLGIPLSVLDLSPVGAGSSPAAALAASHELVAAAERLGYHRYWVAEHHNMPGIASSSPAVLLASLARVTSTIRLGSGGVMLPNHAPLVIAEQFGTLRALYGDRVDLGIGRAPGTDGATAMALRRTDRLDVDDFPQQLADLIGFFTGMDPANPLARIQAAWAEAVGPVIAENAQPLRERGGVLTVLCGQSVWAQEIALMGVELTGRLNAVVGEELVREIRTTATPR